MQTLFENYQHFITEHSSDITSPSDALKLIADNSMFRSYVDALTEHLDSGVRSSVISVCNRQRETLLTEASNVPASAFGFGWTVLSLPILVDIYAEPLIAKLCNVYTTESAIASIPRVQIHATTTKYDGTVVDRVIPTSQSLVRPDFEEVVVAPGTPANLLTTVFGTDSSKFKMNRRYLMVDEISITCTPSGGGSVVRNVATTIRPDNRSQMLKTFTFSASDNATVTATFQGNVNWDTGVVFYHVVIDDDGSTTDTAFEVTTANFLARFTPVSSMVGRTKVFIKTEMTDVTIDQNEDFLIDLTQEDIQD